MGVASPPAYSVSSQATSNHSLCSSYTGLLTGPLIQHIPPPRLRGLVELSILPSLLLHSLYLPNSVPLWMQRILQTVTDHCGPNNPAL